MTSAPLTAPSALASLSALTSLSAVLLIPALLTLVWVLCPPSVHQAATPPPSGRRPQRATAVEVAGMVERLATVLSTGAGMRQAWDAVARSLPAGELADLARAVAAGADPRRVCPPGLRGGAVVGSLGAALTVCERTGAPTVGVLHSLAEALRDLHDAALARRSAFAGPRSTARILLVLPLAGLGLGILLGGDPLRLLATTPMGNLMALLGGVLTAVGWWWMRRLIQQADPPAAADVDPSVVLELVAGALESGLPLARAVTAVAAALEEGPIGSHLERLGSALAAGVPAAVAAGELPEQLAPLGESTVLAETSGADLARVLRSAAKDMRRGTARSAEERAEHLAVRLVLPTGVALLPAFIALGIVPTVMSLLGGTLSLTQP